MDSDSDELTAVSTAALTEAPAAPLPETTPESAAADLPHWRVFLRSGSAQAPAPPVEQAANVVAVRVGDEAFPDRYVVFDLHRNWLRGEAYSSELMQERSLSSMDMVLILGSRSPAWP